MKTLLSVALFATIAFALAAPAFAAQPTQADFDACNRAAQAAVSSPSASPQAGGSTTPQAGGSTMPPAGGAASPQAGATTSPGGVTTGPSATTAAGTPDSTSGVQPGGAAGKTGPMITGTGREPGSTGGVREGTGAVSKDSAGAQPGPSSAQLSGMADRGMTDTAYKTAYQDCMKQRGF
jgi:hypothetical protein